MISFLTKQFQAVPALMPIFREVGGEFITTRINTSRAIKKNNPNATVINYIEKLGKFSAGYQYLEQSDLIITGAPYSGLLKKFGAKKYMIFTGTVPSLTAKQILDDHAHFDKLCAIGPRMMRTIEMSCINVDAVLSGYFPFLSFPEKSLDTKNAVLTETGLDNGKLTIAYLPRGEPYGSFDMLMPQLLKYIPNSPYNLIVRPHPSQSVKLHFRDRIKFLSMQHSIRKIDNLFLDLNALKLANLLAAVDLVITDGNSPAEEALFYDTPQILIESSRLSRASISESMRNEGSSDEDINLALRIYDNGPLLSAESENLMNVIEKALSDKNQYHKARLSNFEFVFGEKSFDRQNAVIKEIAQYG